MNAIGAFRCALSVFVLAYGVRNVSAIGLFCDAIVISTLSQTPRFCVTQDQIERHTHAYPCCDILLYETVPVHCM